MILTNENYFSKEADLEFMSVSQWKNFLKCEAKAFHDLQFDCHEEKEAFLEGQLFEALVAGDSKLFMAKHPELISSRGSTAGQLKSNFAKVVKSAEKFNSQEFFRKIIDKCEKQVVLTGEISGVKVKCCLDLFDKETNSIYDIKCMKDFKEQWSSEEHAYTPWYYTYGYVLQLAVYREIVRQNFGEPKQIGLLAATKEDTPDIQAVSFSSELLDLELEEFKMYVTRYDKIKKGLLNPDKCGCCEHCKSTKSIDRFEVIE